MRGRKDVIFKKIKRKKRNVPRSSSTERKEERTTHCNVFGAEPNNCAKKSLIGPKKFSDVSDAHRESSLHESVTRREPAFPGVTCDTEDIAS